MTRIKYQKPTASGRRTGWARVFTSVDTRTKGAKAFEGYYLRDYEEMDVEVGSLVIEVYPTGSVKNGCDMARFYRVDETGLTEIDGPEFEWRGEFLSLRDYAANLLVVKAALDNTTSDIDDLANDPRITVDRLLQFIDDRGLTHELKAAL